MYLAMIERAFSRTLGRFTSGGWLRSSVTWIVLLVLGLVGFGVAIHERGRGHLHQLKTQLGAKPGPAAPLPQPGGKNPIILSRVQQAGGIAPEFLSATLLPGRGMNVFQIMAYLPGKGEVPLLASPSLADAASAMTGIESDASGAQSLAMGGAIEVPWAGQIFGAALPGGTSVLSNWQGRGITLPVTTLEGANAATRSSVGGLLLRRAADSSSAPGTSEGGTAQATFAVGSFDGNWPSKTEVQTSVKLNAYTLEITVTARNVGTEPEPMGIGWRPRFAIPAGQRSQMRLRLPSNLRTDLKDGLPTGQLIPVQSIDYDFTTPGGTALHSLSLNDTFVHLKGGLLSSGPEVELRNPAGGYGLRITALSPTIKAIHVYAPADKSIIAIDPQTNYDDPFGRQWSKDEDTGLIVLQPGENMQWKIRLELFALPGQHPVGPA
jgi:galactose mutarotase-like enzyme